jgi:hypothetical protein
MGPWKAGVVSAVVPPLYGGFLGLIGISDNDGSLLSVLTGFPWALLVVLALWVPLFLVVTRRIPRTLTNVLGLSVAFWFVHQFALHVLASVLYSDPKVLAANAAGIVVYLALGLLFGGTYWFLACRRNGT